MNSSTLIASLLWGSVGTGFALYGWKQKEMIPAVGGILLVAASYFVSSALLMSVASVAIIAGIFWLKQRF